VKQDLATLTHVQQQLTEVQQELHRLSTQEPWKEAVHYRAGRRPSRRAGEGGLQIDDLGLEADR